VPSDKPGREARRLYVYREECYVIWLEPVRGKSDGWWFSTTYIPFAYQLKKYIAAAILVAEF
jgi:hypothetical protein